LAPLVNQSCHRVVIEIVEPATNQWKPFAGKIHNGRSKIELPVQPGLYGMLIGRSNVSEVVGHQRAHMTGDELSRQKLIGAWVLQSRQKVPSDDCDQKDRCSQG